MFSHVTLAQRLAVLILALSLVFALLIPWHGADVLFNPAPARQLDESLVEAARGWMASVAPTGEARGKPEREEAILPEPHPCGHSSEDKKILDDRLDAIDRALARLSPEGGSNPFLAARYHTGRERLFREAESRRIDCDSLLRLSRWLNQKNGAALSSLAWKERQPGRWAADDPAWVGIDPSRFARPNPWRTLPGCIYLGTEAAAPYWPKGQGSALCRRAGVQAQAAEGPAVPPDSGVLRSALEQKAADHAGGGNTVEVLGRPVSQGAHLWLTLDARAQGLAQQTVACHTGDRAACRAVGLDPARWQDRYEGAAARSVGLIQVDIATGAVEVLASGHTPCFAQDHDGPGRSPECPPLPQEPANRPHQLANHALHGAAMPGSLVKPILALGLLRSDLGPKLRTAAGRQSLLRDIKTSNSKAFLDRLFARERNFADAGRLSHLARAARDLGWNPGCLPPESGSCGSQEVLFGEPPKQGRGLQIVGGRLLMEPEEPDASHRGWRSMKGSYAADWARRCSALDWKQCTGGAAVDLAAEAWGQGHSLASPLAVATLLARLGAAANGARQTTPPHLVARIAHRAQASLAQAAAPQELAIDPQDARLILEGMALTHTAGGTVHAACLAVLGSATRCNRITALAGKTGTPRFKHHSLTLAQRQNECRRLQAGAGQARSHERNALADCYMAPIKWYAALVRADSRPDAPWSKAVVVLAERNWYHTTGLVDSPRDAYADPNVAAEVALRYLSLAFPQIFPSST